jgi:FdhE protein
MKAGPWDSRIERADRLAAAYPFAAEGLRFYAALAAFQKSFYESLSAGAARKARPAGSLRDDFDLPLLLPWFGQLLPFVQKIAPGPLAQTAAELSAAGGGRWEELLDEFWRKGVEGRADLDPVEGVLAWAFLQPYAEHLAASTEPLEIHATPPICPLCSGLPLVGVLRPQGDGGKRSLICSLCAHEWDFRRIVCAACGEESVDKLPVYTAEEIPHVRVEACDTCRSFIKTVDLTKDGHAVPVVDELAALPLSLWAAEKGYVKVSPNLLGV